MTWPTVTYYGPLEGVNSTTRSYPRSIPQAFPHAPQQVIADADPPPMPLGYRVATWISGLGVLVMLVLLKAGAL